MRLLLFLLPLSVVLGDDSVCGTMPESFIDPFGDSFNVHYYVYDQLQLSAEYFPYRVFDVAYSAAGSIWHIPGSVQFLSATGSDSGVYVHIANTDWHRLTNLTGTIYTNLTEADTDLQKINSYICDDFTAMKAMVVTFDCLREDDAPDAPKVRYQLIVAYGKDSNAEEKNFLLILVDILPGDAWDYLSTAKYKYYLSDGTNYYPLSVTEHSVMSFDVTHKQAFVPDVEPDNNGPPCPLPSVTCTLTRKGGLTGFGGNQTSLPQNKTVLVEWNEDHDVCKFKSLANYMNGYQWTYLAVGPHSNPLKFFRYIDFDRIEGKVSQRGWHCKKSCKGEIPFFDYNITNKDEGVTYATVRELSAGQTYVIDTELCSNISQPNYKLTYDFSAVDDDIMATLELSGQFYEDNKDQMSGACLSN